MENIKVVILDPRVVEIWSGMCLCRKGNGIFGVFSFANPYNVSVNPNLPKGDISCYLVLTILVEKDKGVLLCITAVVLTPSSSWISRVVKLFSELRDIGDRTRCGREEYGGVVLSKSDWLVALHIIIQHVTLNFLKDLGNEKEVFDGGVVTEDGGEDLVVKLSVPQDVDRWEEVLRPG